MVHHGAVHERESETGGPSDPAQEPVWVGRLHERIEGIEHCLTGPESRVIREVGRVVVPAWRRVTEGEPRWPVSLAVLAAIGMQAALPQRLALLPRWILPAVALALLIGLLASNPRRINQERPGLRAAGMTLVAVLSLANITSAGRLIARLVQGTEGQDAGPLLLIGGAIWLTNVIVFALWYWELDRGGPVARAHGHRQHPDFLFPQMQAPELAHPDWEPGFADYFYLSFTNATAFSPTDVMPLTPWTKMTMLLQSVVSLSTVALVIARAVNILKG